MCEYLIKEEIKILEYKQKSKIYAVGPTTHHYSGGKVKASDKVITVFNLSMLAENTDSLETLFCFTVQAQYPAIITYGVAKPNT